MPLSLLVLLICTGCRCSSFCRIVLYLLCPAVRCCFWSGVGVPSLARVDPPPPLKNACLCRPRTPNQAHILGSATPRRRQAQAQTWLSSCHPYSPPPPLSGAKHLTFTFPRHFALIYITRWVHFLQSVKSRPGVARQSQLSERAGPVEGGGASGLPLGACRQVRYRGGLGVFRWAFVGRAENEEPFLQGICTRYHRQQAFFFVQKESTLTVGT